MTRTVRLRAEAETDLAEAAVWYENRRPRLGQDFLNEISAGLSIISERPFIYPEILRDTRRALIRRFPFGIYYRIENDEIVVIAVLHASRSPRRWKERSGQ